MAVDLWSFCPSCEKTKRQMQFNFDYVPTGDLVKRPLRYCENPNLRYDLKDLSLYLEKSDLVSILRYLATLGEARVAGILREGDRRVLRALAPEQADAIILSGQYANLFLAFCEMDWPGIDVSTASNEKAFWKRHELIMISGPLEVRMGDGEGMLWHIQFANEYAHEGGIAKKGSAFRKATADLLRWLETNFANWRGKLCFDNPAENLRLFGDRFSPNGTAARRS